MRVFFLHPFRPPLTALLLLAAPACLRAQAVQQVQPLQPTAPINRPQTGVQPNAGPSIIPLPPGSPGSTPYSIQSLVRTPTLSPGALTLLELEGRFSEAVAAGGGKAFVTWFAEDAVTLNNGRPAIQGRGNIAAQANWDPRNYQLTWVAEGAQMGPSNDMGFTWGTYEGRSKDKNGEPVVTTGRYITVWRKQPDGKWKVAMDASANAAPEAGVCCSLPKP
jgi:ketosteroid isomerase-like protein